MAVPTVALSIFMALALLPWTVRAGTLAQCNSGAQAAENQCRAASAALKASDAARSASTAASSGTDIQQNCSNMGRDIGQQQGDIGKAQSQCQAALSRCSSSCTPNPINPSENPSIEQRKQRCIQTIQGELAALGQAMGNLAGNASQAAACKQASEGKPPQMPPMQPPPEEPKEEKPGLNCESAEGVRYSDCNNVFVAKCTKDMKAAYCSEFSDRYCSTATAGNSSMIKAASLVVDKGGEGLGSPFCKMVTAYKFCQATGRGDCPTCRGMYNYSSPECQSNPAQCLPSLTSEQLQAAKNKCPSDPVFMDPVALKKLEDGAKKPPEPEPTTSEGVKVPERVGAGGAQSPGGRGLAFGGDGAGGSGPSVGALSGATPESVPGGVAAGIDTGGGGGASGQNYGLESAEEDDAGKAAGLGAKKPLLPAGPVAGMAKDVSNQFGPNIFTISTTVYRNLCSQGKLLHCNRK